MKRFLLFALAVIVFAACSKDAINEQQNMLTSVDEAPETLVVGFEEGDVTRIQLNEAQKTVWTNGDLVSVFYKSDANQKYEYRGETGERTAELHKVSAGSSTTKMGYVVVAYPYSEEYIISPATGNLETMLPAVQHYALDSYGVGDNLMVSCSEFTQFSLKSVCGWLKLQLTGNGEKVKSITLRGNNGEQVAGLIHVDTKSAEATLYSEEVAPDDNGNANGSLVIDGAMVTELTLDCGEGVALGTEATAFYIALPPQTFENGFTVEIEAMDGHIMTKSTDKTLTIERNHIQPMTAFDFAPSYPLSNEIFYTASEQVTPTNPEAFGTTFISSSWDAETGTGVMIFEDELSYIGDYAFEGNSALLSVLLPNSVTKLRNCCFRYCSNLTKAVIPGEITYFHSASFEQCHALATINCRYSTSDLRHVVMNNIYLAYAPAGAEDCVIPDGVKYVESYVFRGSNIASVVIPASVNNIGEQAFLKSANLMAVYCKPTTPPAINASVNGGIFDGNASGRKIYVPKESVWAYKTAERWSDYADAIVGYDFEKGEIVEVQPNNQIWYTSSDGNVVTPYKTNVFGANIISNTYTDGMGVITFDGDVTMIGESAFDNCNKLTGVTLPECVTSIGKKAFYDCDGLIESTIPDSVTEIGSSAFYSCDKLTIVTVGDSVTTIGNYAFCGCTSLKEFKGKFATEDGRSLIVDNTIIAYANASGTTYTIPDSVTTIGNYAFMYCSSLTIVTIPDSVTTIGNDAFRECDILTSVNIPDSVTSIGNGAFYCCTSLTSVNIPDSVTSIGERAFADCDILTSVNIPDSITSIGNGAFYNCDSLTSVYCKATTPPALGGTSVFDYNGSGRKIYVPAESVDAYKSAQYWSEYASMIVSDPMVYTVLGSYDPNKYITYVEDYDYRGYGDAYDYNIYYYGTTIYSDGLLFSSKVECKFRLNSFSSGTFYISVGEYDDDIYDIYVNTSGLNIGDKLYTWGDMGVSKTDVITLTLSGTTMVVNGKTISGIPSVGRYLDGYIWSGHYHERDDGMWWMDYTFQDGARIYYAKGWNSAGDLIYLGGASLSADGRACWKSTYSEYGTGNIITEEHFPRVTSSFGRGNL